MEKNANARWEHVRVKMMDVRAPHAAPLIAYADQVAAAHGLAPGAVPYPDPEHGGTEAEVLFVFSHAGESAIRDRGGSGLLSLENDDPASRHCFDHCLRVGLGFDRITHWNGIPQPLAKGAKPGVADLNAGGRWLPGLLELLPRLQVVVLLGRNAEKAWDGARPDAALDRFDPLRGPASGGQGTAGTGRSLGEIFDEIAARLNASEDAHGASASATP